MKCGESNHWRLNIRMTYTSLARKKKGKDMEDKNKFDKSDILKETPEEAHASFTPEATEIKADKEPTRFQRFMQKTLTWLAAGAVVFAAGFATFYFTIYQDKVEQLNQVETALANEQDYSRLLSIMVDIYSARIALTEENTSAAKSALSDTQDTLDEIIEVIRKFDANLAETLPQRLSLIRASIDGKIENAIVDCDLMINDLRDIEKSLYQ